MNKIIVTIGFIFMVLAQWLVPANMIREQEAVLTDGTPYKFRTQPIDPSDPFRGKYITLRYEINQAPMKGQDYDYDQELFLYLKKDSLGFAEVAEISEKQLETKRDFVTVTASYTTNDQVHFRLPFNTFFMEESKAYDAEVLVRRLTRDSLPNNCYGLVFVDKGRAVLENVFVNDTPIKDFVEKDL